MKLPGIEFAPQAPLHARLVRRSRLRVSRFLESLFTPPPSTLSAATTRLAVSPPPLRHAPASRWSRLVFWLLAPAPQDAAPPLDSLPTVKFEFGRAIADIRHERSGLVALRIARARSLRELWHVRLDVYNLVAVHHSEFEAERRLGELNRHFPAGSPRSCFSRTAVS